MDGLTGSYAKLRNTEIPLEERIELSRKIFSDSQCFLPNRNQVIVDWSCQELSNIRSGLKKRDKHGFKVDEHEIELWKLLSDVLNDPASEQIVLLQKILPLLFRELDEIKSFLGKYCSENGGLNKMTQDRILFVFLCFQAISKNPNMSMTFFNKLENLEQYLKGILTCFLGVLLQPYLHSANFVQELFHLVVIVLHQYNTAQHQQVAYRKVFTNLCERLLPLLLLARTVIKDEVFHFQDLSRDEIGSAIDAVIISGLFHNDLVLNYHPTAIPQQHAEPSPKKLKLVNSYKQLFDVLECFGKDHQEGTSVEGVNVTSNLACQTISTSLPFLLENFLKATQADGKPDKASKFSFFVDLYNVTAPSDSAGQIPEVTRIEILNKMLNFIVDYDVYQIAEDNANDKPIFKWFLNLLENVLLSQSHHNAGKFHCLDIILKLNHKIIEHSLEIVLAKCFGNLEEGSEDVGKAKVALLSNVVETYTKLQQLENLITCILKVFNKLGNELGTISVDVLTKLSRSFEQCPFNQTLSIQQLFLTEMKEKVQSIEQENGNTKLSLEGISILFVTFLQNSSYNAADPHGLDQKKATSLQQLVEEIKVAIIMPLINAFPTCRKTSQKQVGFSALFHIHGLNSLIMFLHQHNVIPTSDDHYVKMLWDSKVEAYIPNEMWRGLVILRKNRCLRFCMELLVVQRVRCLLLKPNFDQNEFDHMMNVLFNFQTRQIIPEISSVSWNFDLSCVNSMNYPVAHWSLVTQYAPLFIPYCSENQLQAFAEFMVGTLVYQGKEATLDHLVTLYQVSENILKDGELFSLPSLQAAVVKQFWKLLGECLSQVVGDKLSGVFTWEVLEDEVAEMEDGQDGKHERDEANLQSGKIDMNKAISLAQTIASVMNDELLKRARKQPKKCSGDLSMVVHLLKVLQRLPCHQFTPSNKVRCILGSLACDVLIGKAVSGDQTSPDGRRSAVQLSCREIVTTLLQGLLQHREFSAWQVVDMATLLQWLYHTIPERIPAKTSPTNLQSKFLNASKELLKFAVILSLKSPSQASQTTVDFSQELVTSLTGSVKTGNPEMIRCVEVLVNIVSACTEFLEQKGKNNSSLRAACSIISETAVSLVSFTKGTLEDENSCQQEEGCVEMVIMVMKLIGILTRAMGSITESELSKNEEFTNAFEEWSEIVSMLVVTILRKMEDVGNSVSGLVDVSDETTTFITVLADVFKGGQKHCNSIPDELRTQILRKCLEILREIGFLIGEGVDDKGTKSTTEPSKLQEAILELIACLLEEDGGRNCITVLEGVLEWSVEENEASEVLDILTGLSVFRDLLATKVVKQKKKELRSIAGKITTTLLSRAAMNNEILSVVLETVAALVTLGGGVFYPHDISLVFQALALKLEVNYHGSFSRIFMARFNILSWTLFYYPDFVYGAVHVFLLCVRELLKSLLTQGAKMSDGKFESEEAAILLSCVQKMSRLYQEMASHKDVLSKYAIYLLADCVHVMSTQGVPGVMRDVLVQGVHFLFDICNDDGLTKLHVYLPSNERELFRSLKDDYMKHHKFKGNA